MKALTYINNRISDYESQKTRLETKLAVDELWDHQKQGMYETLGQLATVLEELYKVREVLIAEQS